MQQTTDLYPHIVYLKVADISAAKNLCDPIAIDVLDFVICSLKENNWEGSFNYGGLGHFSFSDAQTAILFKLTFM